MNINERLFFSFFPLHRINKGQGRIYKKLPAQGAISSEIEAWRWKRMDLLINYFTHALAHTCHKSMPALTLIFHLSFRFYLWYIPFFRVDTFNSIQKCIELFFFFLFCFCNGCCHKAASRMKLYLSHKLINLYIYPRASAMCGEFLDWRHNRSLYFGFELKRCFKSIQLCFLQFHTVQQYSSKKR